MAYNRRNYGTANGESTTRLYRVWINMISRCSIPTHFEYSQYGGRGIAVCDEWAFDYQAFKEWAINNGYADNLTIDRIDVNGNYEPDNCRWATMREQANNRRSNVTLTYKGKTQTISMWAREIGMDVSTLGWRKRQGWSDERSLTEPLQHTHRSKEATA